MMKQSGKAPKPLIVCYSYSGNTLALAQKIQRLTGAALTQVFPTQPYPSRFEELLVQVRRELRGRHYPKLLPVSEPPTDYDMIFVGSPNWCGTIAPPLASWLRQHNGLAGKTVLPFYSHCGGETGNPEGAVRILCPKAQVGAAFAAIPNKSDTEPALEAWLRQCGALPARAVQLGGNV
ncbi:MAG TPA: flavodoxin [Candidatus Onthomonas avicola]|nr:flavodoxin [Candidatus Onthomonas avicola]